MPFCDISLPQKTKETVISLSKSGRLPQSVMLTGGTANLRRELTMALCSAVLCTSLNNGEPCGKCSACIKAKAGAHPDIIFVSPQNGSKSLSVAQLRQTVLDTLYIAPNEAENKIYVFSDAQEMSVIVQNALLKSIEEPPQFVMFIFECEQREKMLTTVISRVTEFTLGDTLSAKNKKEDADVTAIACGIIDAFCSGDEYSLMLSTAPLNKNRRLAKKTAAKIITVLRDALCEKSGAPLLSGCEKQAIMLSSRFNIASLTSAKQAMDDIITYADKNANENLLISQFSSALGVIRAEADKNTK